MSPSRISFILPYASLNFYQSCGTNNPNLAAVCSNAVILLLLIRCFLLLLLYYSVIVLYFCCAVLYVHSSFAIILVRKRELVALLSLSFWCLVIVVWLFLAMPWVSLAVCDCGISSLFSLLKSPLI